MWNEETKTKSIDFITIEFIDERSLNRQMKNELIRTMIFVFVRMSEGDSDLFFLVSGDLFDLLFDVFYLKMNN